MKYYLKDNKGNVIGFGASMVRECPAKAPGRARICEWPPDVVDVPPKIVEEAATLEVEPVCTDQPFRPMGINFDAIGQTGLTFFMKK